MSRAARTVRPALVVVLAIIALLSGIIFVSLETGEQGLALERTAHKVAQDIRKTAEFSLRARADTCTSPVNFSGYGIHFDRNKPSSYLIFADCNGNNTYQTSDDEIINPILLEDGVQIQSITPTPNLSIVFVPPDPKVFINGNSAANPGRIVLELKSKPSVTRTITINNKGRVTIE